MQTTGRIESGEPGVAVGHVLGLLALPIVLLYFWRYSQMR